MRVRLAAVLLAVLGAACERPQSDGQSAERARQAEAEFAKFGARGYTVLSFRADPERQLELTDDYSLPIPLYEVPFAARVRITGGFTVPPRGQWRALVGTPGWSADRLLQDAQASQVFGDVERRPGEELAVEGAAMFDRLETGWRYRGLDKVR